MNIAEHNFINNPELNLLAKLYLQHINDKTLLKVESFIDEEGERMYHGEYKDSTNVINIDGYHIAKFSDEEVAKTVLHEVSHSLISNYMNQYFDKNGKLKTEQ